MRNPFIASRPDAMWQRHVVLPLAVARDQTVEFCLKLFSVHWIVLTPGRSVEGSWTIAGMDLPIRAAQTAKSKLLRGSRHPGMSRPCAPSLSSRRFVGL